MANTKISDLTALSVAPDSGDLLVVVDVSDTTMASSGTDKKLAYSILDGVWASQGANSDITSLTGLTTPLTVAQGGTGAATHTSGNVLLGAGTGAITSVGTSGTGNVVRVTSASLVTPALGAATAVSINGLTVTTTTGTLTLANSSSIITSGGNAITFTSSGTTGVTLPTSGTLATLAGSEALTNKTLNGLTVTSSTGTLTIANSSSLITSGGFAVTLTSTGTTGVTLPTSGTLTTLAGTETLSSKRITQRIGTVTDAATVTPTGDSSDQYNVTALGQAATIAIPSGTPTNGQKLIIRLLDNGTARALTWTTSAGGYRVIGVTLPTTTVLSKTTYVGCIYNSADSFWDVVAVQTQA